MHGEIIYREGNYQIRRFPGIPEDAIAFLDSIAWGNEGAVYEHMNTEEHIRHIHQPTLIAIYEGDQIMGSAVFCNTPVAAAGSNYNCYYIRYFASSPAIRGKGVMKHFSIKVMELIRQQESQKTVYYACIERGNRGSYRVVESAGYRHASTIKTAGFSRFFPKSSQAVTAVQTEEEKNMVHQLLTDQYRDHALVQFNALFMNDDYYLLREGGEIVAGCQYHRVHWVVNNMEGITGRLIMNLAPWIPLLNQLFNPRRFEFLAFEGIYFKPGHEDKLHELFEHLLAKEQLKSGMFWMGESCPYYRALVNRGRLGLIHSFVKDADVFILASYQHMDEEDISRIEAKPLYASAFDYI